MTARANVQWKGTDACMYLWCECGQHSHFDGYFAQQVQCPHCQRVWAVPHGLPLLPGDPDQPFLTAVEDDDV